MAQSTLIGTEPQTDLTSTSARNPSEEAAFEASSSSDESSSSPPAKKRRSRRPADRASRGVPFTRHFSSGDQHPFDEIVWERRRSVITNPDGPVVFKMDGAEIPKAWSQLATDIVVSKYFRKAGLGEDKSESEKSVRQVVTRVARTIRTSGENFGGYFA